jgi:hypothetical protein
MRSDERSTVGVNEAGDQSPPLEDVLAAHLLPPGAVGDFGLDFEEELAAQETSSPAPLPPAAPAPIKRTAERSSGPAAEDTSGRGGTAELTAEELAWALGWEAATSPWTERPPAVRRNRRTAARHAVSTRASVKVASAGAAETAQLTNLSTGGVSALLDRPLRRGDTFWITLRSPGAHAAVVARTVSRRCQVLRCERGGTGKAMYGIAAQFVA